MRSYLVIAALAIISPFVAAAPIEVVAGVGLDLSANTIPLVPRNIASPPPAKAWTRRLYGLLNLSNLDWDGLTAELNRILTETTDLTTDQAATVLNALVAILKGENLNEATAKLLSIPGHVLARLPNLLGPALKSATMGLPGVNNLILIALDIIAQLGRDTNLAKRQLLNVGLNELLPITGLALPSQVLELVLRIVGSLLAGRTVDPEDAQAFNDLDSSVLDKILDALPSTLSNALGTSVLGGSYGPIHG
ncbi:hypothetical protein CC85DRAFT_329337 [Cutaneotrichosporon oleaginosum]|uniref:Uncharacterized protein n=1 Tax=Cutaneotrichosporon oleaginosum TaxID=879819 RepID=A0A0J0XJ44_9TREE|nr:uncharacterized protein CC85DRAFT_329337 [Cutaneotrichosporon oleaginosum]KLT41107.1 hypothetical protein CC85DRAFT_329337 [Cutaneotrichosporon oleaginosum]TXT05761.1 hypothetical protein COLE_07081 [Cutaneotrichosporon oleaginosum]